MHAVCIAIITIIFNNHVLLYLLLVDLLMMEIE